MALLFLLLGSLEGQHQPVKLRTDCEQQRVLVSDFSELAEQLRQQSRGPAQLGLESGCDFFEGRSYLLPDDAV